MPKQRRKRPTDGRIGERLAKARKARGFSQGWLAKRIGVSVGTIQAYEHGRSRIAASRLVALADALRCEPTELLKQSESQPMTIHVNSRHRLYGTQKDE
jgi:transcriptional regulator with XRE-family HTH domain